MSSLTNRRSAINILATLNTATFCTRVFSANEIRIGQLASTTNPISAAGAVDHNAGLVMAVDRINRSGGVRGRPIRLILRDDQYNAEVALKEAQDLVDTDGIVALVGCFGTQPLIKLSQSGFLERNRIASIAPVTGLATAMAMTNVFSVRGSYEDEVAAMFRHSKQLGRNRVAFLHFDAGVGTLLARAAVAIADKESVVLLGPVAFPVVPKAEQVNAVDKAWAKSLGSTVPQSIVTIAAGVAQSEAIKAIRTRFGRSMPIYALSLTDHERVVADVGLEDSRGIMLTQVMPHPASIELTILREFQEDLFRLRSVRSASYMMLEGYVAGRVTTEILQKAASATREAVLNAAATLGNASISGYRVQYTPQVRRALNPVEITMIDRSGKLIK